MSDQPSDIKPSDRAIAQSLQERIATGQVTCEPRAYFTGKSTNAFSGDRAIDTVASGPAHSRNRIVAQLLDSAEIKSLPGWVRDLFTKTADAIEAQPPPAALAEPVPSAEHWRVAIANIFGADMIETVEQRAIALAREGGK